jgi:hypothetical protein
MSFPGHADLSKNAHTGHTMWVLDKPECLDTHHVYLRSPLDERLVSEVGLVCALKSFEVLKLVTKTF